jgi:hypothetical protein
VRSILAALLSLGLALPAWALDCPMGQKECNGRCVPQATQCDIADSSNKFLLLGVLVGVGALVGLGFYLNPSDDEPEAPAKATAPIDFTVHENGGGLLLRGTF